MQGYGRLSKPQMLALWLADLSKIKLNSREQWSSSGGRKGHANVIPTSQTPHLLTLPSPASSGLEGISDLFFIFIFSLPFLVSWGHWKWLLLQPLSQDRKKWGELLFWWLLGEKAPAALVMSPFGCSKRELALWELRGHHVTFPVPQGQAFSCPGWNCWLQRLKCFPNRKRSQEPWKQGPWRLLTPVHRCVPLPS